jgi:hypothetical protein
MLEQTAVSMAARHVSLSWNEHLNMVGWAIYVSGTSAGGDTLYEYPGTCVMYMQSTVLCYAPCVFWWPKVAW